MKLLMVFTSLLFCLPLTAQQKVQLGDKIVLSQESSMYTEPSIIGKAIKLSPGDTIIIIGPEDKYGYYHIKTKNLMGYLVSTRITQELKNLITDPTLLKANARSKEWEASHFDQSDQYIELYGKPDDTSDYSSGDYKSKTLVWHCAKGKYRSIDFRYVDGSWIKESEYTSDCI